MKVCYISYYPRKDYPRQVQFINALKDSKFEHHIILNTRVGLSGYLEILRKYIVSKRSINYDVVILGFRTTELFFPIKLLSPGKKIIFDCFVPLYSAFFRENKWQINTIIKYVLAPLVYIYEKLQLNYSDHIITDTKSHAESLNKLYKTENKISPIYLGNPFLIDIPPETLKKKPLMYFIMAPRNPYMGPLL